MAHGDTLIFLNTLTWVAFLFFLLYFLLVTFFLPSLYKRVRCRTKKNRRLTRWTNYIIFNTISRFIIAAPTVFDAVIEDLILWRLRSFHLARRLSKHVGSFRKLAARLVYASVFFTDYSGVSPIKIVYTYPHAARWPVMGPILAVRKH